MAKKQKKKSLLRRAVEKVIGPKKAKRSEPAPIPSAESNRQKALDKESDGIPADQPSDSNDVHNTPATSLVEGTSLDHPTKL